MKKNQDELFRFVDYSAEAAERIGYSNYSYWRSVLQNFLKKKAAAEGAEEAPAAEEAEETPAEEAEETPAEETAEEAQEDAE